MRRPRPHFSAVLCGVIAASIASTGCVYHHDVAGTSNGNGGVLSFRGTHGSDLRAQPSAVGATRRVEVRFIPGGSVECHRLGKVNVDPGLAIQGGSGPDLSDKCDRAPAVAIQVATASCADDACEVTSEPITAPNFDGPGVLLRVVAKREGHLRLDVTVTSQSDGESHRDSIDLDFAQAKRMRVIGTAPALLPFRLPVLPGVAFPRPAVALVDASEQVLAVDEDLTKPEIEGSAVRLSDDDFAIEAVTAGRSTLRWSVPGALPSPRAIEIEVVSPASAQSLVVLAPDSAPRYGGEAGVDFDSAPGPAAAAVTNIALTTPTTYAKLTFGTRARLADGRLALAALTKVEVTPAIFAQFDSPLFEPWSFFATNLPAVGEGSVVLQAAALSTTIPLRVTSGADR